MDNKSNQLSDSLLGSDGQYQPGKKKKNSKGQGGKLQKIKEQRRTKGLYDNYRGVEQISDPGPSCKYRRHINPNKIVYDYEDGYFPLAAYDNKTPERNADAQYLLKKSFTLFALQVLLQIIFTLVCMSSEGMINLVQTKNILGIFVGIYLFSVIILIADVDLRFQRIFPLNYAVWLASTLGLSCMTTYIIIVQHHRAYLVLSMMTILLLVSTIYAYCGHLDCGGQKEYKELAIQFFSMLITIIIASCLLAINHDQNGSYYSGMIPKPLMSDYQHSKSTLFYTQILIGWGLFVILFFEADARLLKSGWHKENISKHDHIYGTAKLSFDLLLSSLVGLIIVLFIIFMISMCLEGGGGSATDADGCCCCQCECVDARCIDACFLNGHVHSDCVCGNDTRTQFQQYHNQKHWQQRQEANRKRKELEAKLRADRIEQARLLEEQKRKEEEEKMNQFVLLEVEDQFRMLDQIPEESQQKFIQKLPKDKQKKLKQLIKEQERAQNEEWNKKLEEYQRQMEEMGGGRGGRGRHGGGRGRPGGGRRDFDRFGGGGDFDDMENFGGGFRGDRFNQDSD